MSDTMTFPVSWEDFLQEYSFKDKEEIYTNGSDLISVFRVRQMMEHYHHDWVSVKDKLPEQYTDVIVFTKGSTIAVDYVDENGDFYYYGQNVTHWMPLPEPPESEDDA